MLDNMELKDTIDLMTSSDYKERFKAEYYQLKIRYYKLRNMLDKWNKNLLDFTPTCSKGTYIEQLNCMERYIATLEMRADIENIEL